MKENANLGMHSLLLLDIRVKVGRCMLDVCESQVKSAWVSVLETKIFHVTNHIILVIESGPDSLLIVLLWTVYRYLLTCFSA